MLTKLEKQPKLSRVDLIKAPPPRLEGHFASKLQINHDLKRTLVSFQANKNEPGFRWFKYKEGFSSALVDYVFDRCKINGSRIIDPFAGSGATLFVASRRGLDSTGIELLPIGGGDYQGAASRHFKSLKGYRGAENMENVRALA